MKTETIPNPTPEQIERMVKDDPQNYHFGACPDCGAVGELIHVYPKTELTVCRDCMNYDSRVMHVCSSDGITETQLEANRDLIKRCTERRFITPTVEDLASSKPIRVGDLVQEVQGSGSGGVCVALHPSDADPQVVIYEHLLRRGEFGCGLNNSDEIVQAGEWLQDMFSDCESREQLHNALVYHINRNGLADRQGHRVMSAFHAMHAYEAQEFDVLRAEDL